MDRPRYSAIAHRGMAFWNPIDERDLDRLVDRLPLPAGALALDVGCGRGEVLLRVAERHRAYGVGVDLAPLPLALARVEAATRVPPGRVTFREESFASERFDPRSFDLAVCVGASHAAGGFDATLTALSGLVRPGGLLLVGEGYWKREPDPGYLAATGIPREEFSDEPALRARAADGRALLDAALATDAAWDRYEGAYARNVEAYARANPDDPDAAAMLARVRPWRDAYLRWGRDTLGFALYALRTPEHPR